MSKPNSSLGLVIWRAVCAERAAAAREKILRNRFMNFSLLQELAEPFDFLIVAMHHIPDRPTAMIVTGIADELSRHVLLAQRHVHLLILFDGHTQIGFTVNEEGGCLDVGRVSD